MLFVESFVVTRVVTSRRRGARRRQDTSGVGLLAEEEYDSSLKTIATSQWLDNPHHSCSVVLGIEVVELERGRVSQFGARSSSWQTLQKRIIDGEIGVVLV